MSFLTLALFSSSPVTNHAMFEFGFGEKPASSPKSHCSRMETLTGKLFQDLTIGNKGFSKEGLGRDVALLWGGMWPCCYPVWTF